METKLYNQVSEAIRKIVETGNPEKVVQLLNRFHADCLEQVDETDYPGLLEELHKLESHPESVPDTGKLAHSPAVSPDEEPCKSDTDESQPLGTSDPESPVANEEGVPSKVFSDQIVCDSKQMDLPPEVADPSVEAVGDIQPILNQTSEDQSKVLPEASPEKTQRLFYVLSFDSRKAKVGKQQEVSAEAIYNELQHAAQADITLPEYLNLSSEVQVNYKDRGLYILGRSKDGKRNAGSLMSRSGLTLDLDTVPDDILERLKALPFTVFYHPTFKSSRKALRIRVVVLLSRDVTPEEYENLAHCIAKLIGEEYIDLASYKATQAMYFPVVPKGGSYWCRRTEGPLLNPDNYLLPSVKPESTSERTVSDDPREKVGWVGAYNRAYPIKLLLAKFLTDIYEPTSDPNRYHYCGSDSTAGMMVYDDGYACSFHASDPAHGQRLCSFDLIRIHRFGHLDKGLPAGTPFCELPSQKAMLEFAKNDPAVRQEYKKKAESSPEWEKELKKDSEGNIVSCLENSSIILMRDPQLSSIRYNIFRDQYEADRLPWTRHSKQWCDLDWNNLYCYLDKHYGFYQGANTAFNAVIPSKKYYHPVRDYINAQVWDGVERLDTLLIDYLGAEDTAYTRAVTRKAMTAMVARVFDSSVKFDYMPVICGPQGIGKSTLLAKMAICSEWFTDSVSVSDMRDVKKAGEKIQGKLIVEISELRGMRSTDVESVKAFLSSNKDNYRKAFDINAADHPRQCIIWGTTNSINGYLRDITGNRRFWPINVSGHGTKCSWDLDDATVGQIIAETKFRFDQGEELYLSGELAKVAGAMQCEAMEKDEREGLVFQYLNTLLPEGWNDMNVYERRKYLENPTSGTIVRDRVSVIEISCECFGQDPGTKLTRQEGNAIRVILRAHSDEWELHTGTNGKPIAQLRRPYGKHNVYYRVTKEDNKVKTQKEEQDESKESE